jgi:hypothetical protein
MSRSSWTLTLNRTMTSSRDGRGVGDQRETAIPGECVGPSKMGMGLGQVLPTAWLNVDIPRSGARVGPSKRRGRRSFISGRQLVPVVQGRRSAVPPADPGHQDD